MIASNTVSHFESCEETLTTKKEIVAVMMEWLSEAVVVTSSTCVSVRDALLEIMYSFS